jgi:hypothetical protein
VAWEDTANWRSVGYSKNAVKLSFSMPDLFATAILRPACASCGWAFIIPSGVTAAHVNVRASAWTAILPAVRGAFDVVAQTAPDGIHIAGVEGSNLSRPDCAGDRTQRATMRTHSGTTE